jgi:hypothetical protein
VADRKGACLFVFHFGYGVDWMFDGPFHTFERKVGRIREVLQTTDCIRVAVDLGEGVDLDRLAELMRDYVKKNVRDGTVESALLFQTLTNTNSWRSPENRRGSHEIHAVFSTERPDSK